ncbi:MAG: alpha/beta hydrolase, partial [Acidimicrobiales bacterium]
RPLVTIALVATLTLAACATEADDPVATEGTTTTDTSTPTDGSPVFTPDPIEWDDCGGVECATLDVPLDYADPEGELVEIYAVRSPATGDRKGALFVNPGGPGAGAAEMAEVLPLILPSEITDHFDIVGVDPRGVGGSTPIDCGVDATDLYAVDSSIDSPEDEAALLEISQQYADDCGEQHGDLLPHLGTRDVARDMDAVRAAMGDDQLSFLGFSYGTAIGQVYADLFPDRVRSMVLDGVLELGPTGLELAQEQAAGFETALDRFVEFCDAAEGCAIAGESRAAVEEVLALAEEPGGIPAPDADRPAGPGEANLGISYALYSQQLWGQLDSALAAALAGDGSELVDLADGYIGIGDFEVYFAVNCLDFAWPTGDPDAFLSAAKATAEESPHFGEALVNDYIRCVDWPTPPVPLEATSAPGTPPILVISTTGDPATPYEGGVAVADTLENGILITNEGDGHTVVADGKPCIDDLVVAYLVDDVVPEDGTTCS